MTTIGILGTGHLAALMVRGLQGSDYRLLLSPRGARIAGQLADAFGCDIARSNQDVIDRAEGVFVALPAATGIAELAQLRFRPGQPVLSAMAGTRAEPLAAAIAPACGCMTMMPGYANALRVGPSILFPAAPFWESFLQQVGPVHVLETEAQFLAAATFGGFSGASFAWMASIIDWFTAQGLSSDLARRLVAATLRGNAEVLLQEHRSLDDIRGSVATPGGITELTLARLADDDALDAWHRALDAVAARIKG